MFLQKWKRKILKDPKALEWGWRWPIIDEFLLLEHGIKPPQKPKDKCSNTSLRSVRKLRYKVWESMSFSVKEINGNDLVHRESHFNWGKISALFKRNVWPSIALSLSRRLWSWSTKKCAVLDGTGKIIVVVIFVLLRICTWKQERFYRLHKPLIQSSQMNDGKLWFLSWLKTWCVALTKASF
jgi:hypothetical protein